MKRDWSIKTERGILIKESGSDKGRGVLIKESGSDKGEWF